MPRKLLLGVAAVILAAASFGVTSYALGSAQKVGLRSSLPARGLPLTSPSERTKVAINNLVGAASTRFGITSDSFEQTRQLAITSAGPLYLVPGSRGACLALGSAVSCGDPGSASEPVLALFTTSGSGVLVGGGVVSSDVRSVTLATPGAAPLSLPSRAGVFVVTERNSLEAAQTLRVEAIR